MIADTYQPPVNAGIPLLTPGHTFKDGGREMIMVQPLEGGDLIAVEVVRSIATDLIDPHPRNRTWCDPEAQKELVESMRIHGQSTPGILRPHPTIPGRYQLIAAWRRWQACQELKWPLQAVVRDLDDVQALEQLYLENAQRENLRPLDEAELIEGMLELRDAQNHRLFTLERVAQARYGSSKPADMARVSKVHKLLQLPEILRGPVNEGSLGLEVAFLVARIADPVDREKAGTEVLKDPYTQSPMTVKRARELIASKYQVSLKGWKEIDRLDLLTEDEKIAMGFTGQAGTAADGSCSRCPFLARNNPMFQDSLATGRKQGSGESGIDPLTCTRAGCHSRKVDNEWKIRALSFAKKNGLTADDILSADVRLWEYVELEDKPRWNETGGNDHRDNPKLPTWAQILKGTAGVVKVAQNSEDEPILVCLRTQALSIGREKFFEFFTAADDDDRAVYVSPSELKDLKAKRDSGDISEQEAVTLKQAEEQAEINRVVAARRDMERAVTAETRIDCLRELLEQLTAKGPGVAGAKALVMAVCRDVGADVMAFITGETEEVIEDKYEYDFEPLLTKHLEGRSMNEMLAIAAVAAVWDDVNFSGHESAADFRSLCEAVSVDCDTIHARVKRAHEAVFKAQEEGRKAEQAGGKRTKKASKSSTDPVNVSAAKEADKTAAADARAGDDRVVLLEFSDESEEPALIEALLNHEIPVTPPNEYGIFTRRAVFTYEPADGVGFALDLARTADGQWASGFDFRVGEKDGQHGNLPADDALCATREQALLGALNALYVDWTGATPAKRLFAAHEGVRAMLSRIIAQVEAVAGPAGAQVADDEESGPEDKLSIFAADAPAGAEGAGESVVDYAKVDVDAAAMALKAGTHEMADFIGKKPHKQKEMERFKAWDRLRDKIARRAGLKK